jgi:type IV secretory pathway TrbD component
VATIQRLSESNDRDLLVRQSARRGRKRAFMMGTDRVQAVLMGVAAFAIVTLITLDFFFS